MRKAGLKREQQQQCDNQREQGDGFGQGKAQNADAEHLAASCRVASDRSHKSGEDVADTNANTGKGNLYETY